MAKPRLKKWVCPGCGGGALAPERPRKDDVRRYCLTCSAKSGRLVERVCPSIEAERQRKATARREAAVRKRERERAALTAQHMVAGLDVRQEWARLCRLPFVRERLPWRTVPLKVAWSRVKDYTTGHAHYGGSEVHLTFYPDVTAAEAKALIAHELAHVIASNRGHGEAFRRTFALVLFHGYGVPVESWEPLAGDRYAQHVAAERAVAAHEGVAPDSGRIRHDERREDERGEIREALAAKGGEGS